MNDSRSIHIKVVGGRFVTVLPPGPVETDETVWRVRKPRPNYEYAGLSIIEDLADGAGRD